MPGLVGIVSRDGGRRRALGPMLEAMLHDRRYGSSRLELPGLNAAIGWTCLSAAFAEGQPIWNAERKAGLFLTGETFAEGPQETSAVLEAYLREGPAFVTRLNGWFSGVILDARAGKVFLFNDRYGLSRIYYASDGGGFYFAAEAKALLAVLPRARRLEPEALAEQFTSGCVLGNRSLFSGVKLLPPGTWATLADGEVRQEKYFHPASWEKAEPLDHEAYYRRLRELFPTVVQRYLKSDKPMAMSLTGGLDGRMVMAWRGRDGALPCYSFGGTLRDCADVRLARRIAKGCGLPHQTIAIEGSFFEEFPDLAARTVRVSDGAMDVSGAVEWYVNRAAARIAPVRLTGNYGSEILRGNVAFRAGMGDVSFLSADFRRLLPGAIERYQAERQGVPRTSFIAFKQVPWHHYARLSVEQAQLTIRTPYLDNELVQLAFRAPPEETGNATTALRLIAEGNWLLGQIPTDRGLSFQARPVWGKWRHWWQEATVRAEYVYDYGMPGWLARANYYFSFLRLERLFLGRHKFYHFRAWYRDQLAGYVRAVLLDPRCLARPYLRREGVERIVAEHVSGRGNHTLAIHRLLSTELLQRELLEGS